MGSRKSQHTFNFLQQHTHRVNEDYLNQLPLYKNTEKSQNDSQYWLFSDLYNLFGPIYVGDHSNIINTTATSINLSNFEKLPKKNAAKEPRAPNFHTFFSDHVVSIVNDYDIKEPQGKIIKRKNGQDARLSRYACWTLLKQWPNMIFAQLYFMMPDATFEQVYNAAYKFSRIYHRTELAQAEKIVNGIAYKHNADMRQFNNFMHRAFFYTTDIDKIKYAYGINGTIFDYMGSQSLMARHQALNIAINHHNTCNKMPFESFINILSAELIKSRVKMIQRTGRAPEADISQKSVGRVASELKKMEREFINKFAFQSLR